MQHLYLVEKELDVSDVLIKQHPRASLILRYRQYAMNSLEFAPNDELTACWRDFAAHEDLRLAGAPGPIEWKKK